MKTLEERLRDAGERFDHETDPTGSLWVALHDALAIVADAPRIYRGEEIRDAPEGLYAIRFRPTGKKARDWTEIYFESTCIRFACRCSDDSGTWEFFGPLPTNSPSEGKG